VTVDQAGHVIYRGRQFVRVTGERRTTIDPGKVAALVGEFQRIRFYELQSIYTAPVSDLAATRISLNLDGASKRITDILGAPAALQELERQIDEVTNTRHWVYLDPAAIREIQASAKPMAQATLDSELLRSVWRDDVETAQALIAAGASPNSETAKRTPLSGVESAAMVRMLVAAGAVVDLPDDSGGTALGEAAAYQDVEVVEALLKAGAKVDGLAGSKWPPLIAAAGEGRTATVEVLLKAGANPRARTESGETALDEANGTCQRIASLSAGIPAGLVPLVTSDDCRKIVALLKAALAK
jgi:hypothetical protein